MLVDNKSTYVKNVLFKYFNAHLQHKHVMAYSVCVIIWNRPSHVCIVNLYGSIKIVPKINIKSSCNIFAILSTTVRSLRIYLSTLHGKDFILSWNMYVMCLCFLIIDGALWCTYKKIRELVCCRVILPLFIYSTALPPK
jgi:hypothetical protein